MRIRKPQLSLEEVKRLLNYDPLTGVFTWRVFRVPRIKPGMRAGYQLQRYRRICIARQNCYEHRLAWYYMYGVWPKEEIDHINGDKKDNRIANLREASRSENCRNAARRRDNTCGLKGVTYFRPTKKWTAQISRPGLSRRFGYFNTPEEAYVAYCKEAQHHYGEFACIDRAPQAIGSTASEGK